MAQIQWKQISPYLSGSGELTGSLELSGSLFINNIEIDPLTVLSIFRETGSFYATTNDLQITGSLDINLPSGKEFNVKRGNQTDFTINEQGVTVFGEKTGNITPVVGGLIYSASNEYFLGFS